MSLHRPLNIFVPHCSDLLTDHRPHGDGLSQPRSDQPACGARSSALHRSFPDRLAKRPYRPMLICSLKNRDWQTALRPGCITCGRFDKLFSLADKSKSDSISFISSTRSSPDVSLALIGCRSSARSWVPLFARWPDDPTALSSSRSDGSLVY